MRQSTGTPRRGRFRFLYQFSLRTLLLVTAGVALFCNWYFQPKYHEDELAGKDLRVRQQMKVVRPKPVELPTAAASIPGVPGTATPLPEPRLVNHGHYTLLDADDFDLARGQFADGSESGRWVTYYPTGHKAAEGKMHSGVKVGLWRTWYEDGTLASEVTYADRPVEHEQLYRDYWEWAGPGGGSGIFPNKVIDPHIDCYASREGPAKARHANGQLRYEGQNHADEQEGLWKYYDEQGHLTASGPFRAGKRHGEWTLIRSASERNAGTTEKIEYINGRTREQLDRLLARLEKQLASPQRYRRAQALLDLAEIGEEAVPLLEVRLANADKIEQMALLGVLSRMNEAAEPVLPQVRELAKSGEPAVVHQARLTLFQLDPGSREALRDGLLADAIACPSASQCLRELVVLYRSDKSRQGDTFAKLLSLPTRRQDIESEQIAESVQALGGNVGPHILAAIHDPDPDIRLRGAKALLALFKVWLPARTYVRFEEAEWVSLLARLKSDPSPEVRALAPEIEQGPQFYGGVGGFGGGGGGGVF